ncbi:MAG: hypothetical protein ACI9ES_002857 [Oceanospirillaceae bacterium]|jgi:hypothetical protein
MPENKFSEFRKSDGIKLQSWRPRRFRHSTSNWFRAKWSSSKKSKAGDLAKSAVTDLPALAGTTIGLWSIFHTGLLTTAASGAVAGAVITAPLTASIAGLIGLGFMAAGAYSNRDQAHNKLLPFVWNLIDNVPPSRNIYHNETNLEEAAKHANYLMKEASSQFAIMGDKLTYRRDKFNLTWIDYQVLVAPFQGNLWSELQGLMTYYTSLPVGGRPEELNLIVIDIHSILNSAAISAAELIEKHSKQGGDIFEFMRRLVKVGNYLQCANIISVATYSQLKCNPTKNQAVTDPFLSWDLAIEYRERITHMSNLRNEVEINYAKWENFARINGFS